MRKDRPLNQSIRIEKALFSDFLYQNSNKLLLTLSSANPSAMAFSIISFHTLRFSGLSKLNLEKSNIHTLYNFIYKQVYLQTGCYFTLKGKNASKNAMYLFPPTCSDVIQEIDNLPLGGLCVA